MKTFAVKLIGLGVFGLIVLAIGLIKDWQADNRVAVIRAPDVNTEQVRCFVIGDVRLEIDD